MIELRQVAGPEHMQRTLGWPRQAGGPDRLWIQEVIFGHRVRLGTVDTIHADYCCGAQPEVVETTYAALAAFLRAGGNWQDLPRQRVKPLWNDQACWDRLLELAGVDYAGRRALLARHPPDRMDALDLAGRPVGPMARPRPG